MYPYAVPSARFQLSRKLTKPPRAVSIFHKCSTNILTVPLSPFECLAFFFFGLVSTFSFVFSGSAGGGGQHDDDPVPPEAHRARRGPDRPQRHQVHLGARGLHGGRRRLQEPGAVGAGDVIVFGSTYVRTCPYAYALEIFYAFYARFCYVFSAVVVVGHQFPSATGAP